MIPTLAMTATAASIVSMTGVAMSSLFFLQSSSYIACSTSFGVTAFLMGSLVGRLAGSLVGRGILESLTLITEERLVGVNV